MEDDLDRGGPTDCSGLPCRGSPAALLTPAVSHAGISLPGGAPPRPKLTSRIVLMLEVQT